MYDGCCLGPPPLTIKTHSGSKGTHTRSPLIGSLQAFICFHTPKPKSLTSPALLPHESTVMTPLTSYIRLSPSAKGQGLTVAGVRSLAPCPAHSCSSLASSAVTHSPDQPQLSHCHFSGPGLPILYPRGPSASISQPIQGCPLPPASGTWHTHIAHYL